MPNFLITVQEKKNGNLDFEKTERYVVVADHHATPFALSELKKFTVALNSQTGAQLFCALLMMKADFVICLILRASA